MNPIITGIGAKMQRDFSRMVRGGGMNSVVMQMHWKEYTQDPNYDANFESAGGSIFTEHQEEVRAMVHVLDYASTANMRFAEVEAGNLIVDFDATLDLTGKEDVYFSWNGKKYVQKNVGNKVAESLDVQCGDSVMCKTLLLSVRV